MLKRVLRRENPEEDRALNTLQDFPAFYSEFERIIRSMLFQIIGHADDLDDLVQATFIKCWEKRNQFEGRSKLSTWVIRIAINTAKDHFRSSGFLWRQRSDQKEHDQLIASESRLDDRELVHQALNILDLEHRTAIALFYFQDLSIDEISQATCEPVGTIKSRLHYAKAKLRDWLKNQGVRE